MRPKSMATVVDRLLPTWLRSSTPAEASVIAASVVSGRISDTAPMNVVLPTPKPPAITILTGMSVAAGAGAPTGTSTGAKSTEQPLEGLAIGMIAGLGNVHGEEALGGQVRHQDPRRAEGHADASRHLGDGDGPTAEQDDVAALELDVEHAAEPFARGRHERLHGQVVACRADTALCDRVGRDDASV